MPLDAIFQLASMTKIMTSVGALTLNEEGRLPLMSRLGEYLPAFEKMNVGSVSSAGEITTEPAKPIFIHDLFRHTSGIIYGGRGNTPIHKLYPGGSAVAAAQYTGEEILDKLASLPLLYQPGHRLGLFVRHRCARAGGGEGERQTARRIPQGGGVGQGEDARHHVRGA